MTRWALFLDYRGFPRVEQVNEGIHVFTKYIPARPEKRRWWGLGKIIQHERPAERRQFQQFDDDLYDRDRYDKNAFRDPPEGFERNHRIVYCEPNFIGALLT